MSRAESDVRLAAAWFILCSSLPFGSCSLEPTSSLMRVDRALPTASISMVGDTVAEGPLDIEPPVENDVLDGMIDLLRESGADRTTDIGAATPEVAPCALMSGRSSRVTLLEVVPSDNPQCDADSNGVLDAQDMELNAVLEDLRTRGLLNDSIHQLIDSLTMVTLFDPRGWDGDFVKAVMDLYDAEAFLPECQEPGQSGISIVDCEVVIPAASQNYNSCATTGIHGVEYGPPGTAMASVVANVLLTPPLFGLKTALLFRQSRLQGTIMDDGTMPQALWCGELDVGELSQRIGESCAGEQHPICQRLESFLEQTTCTEECTLVLRLSTAPVSMVSKANVLTPAQ